MPTPTKGSRLGSGPAHQRLMLANLATALFQHGRITTTEAKAKRLRPVAERLITFAKRGDLHARRQALAVVRDKGVIHTLFSEIGPRYGTRNGGYTRITKVGPRKGDNAPMAVIELVEEAPVPAPEPEGASRGRRTARPRRAAAGTQTATQEEAPARDSATEEIQEDAQEAHQAAAPEADDQPAEEAASGQTVGADEHAQAEGEAEEGPVEADAEEGKREA